MFERIARGGAPLTSIAADPAAAAGGDEPLAAPLGHRLVLGSEFAHQRIVDTALALTRMPIQPAPGSASILAGTASLQVPPGLAERPRKLGFRSAFRPPDGSANPFTSKEASDRHRNHRAANRPPGRARPLRGPRGHPRPHRPSHRRRRPRLRLPGRPPRARLLRGGRVRFTRRAGRLCRRLSAAGSKTHRLPDGPRRPGAPR